MTSTALPPGVYFELDDPPPPGLAPVRSDIAGFVGFAERGPLHEPVQVESWEQFRTRFGTFGTPGFLPYGVRAFFQNGGRTAYVVRVAVPFDDVRLPVEERASAAWAYLDTRDDAEPALELVATSPGRWGNRVVVEVASEAGGRLTLSVNEVGGGFWRVADVSLDPADERFLPTVLDATGGLPVRVGETETTRIREIAEDPARQGALALPNQLHSLRGGRDGIASAGLAHLLEFDGIRNPTDPPVRWGLSTLEFVDQVALLVVPDACVFPLPRPSHAPVPWAPCDLLEVDPGDATRVQLRADRQVTVQDLAHELGVSAEELVAWNPGLEGLAPADAVPVPRVVLIPLPAGARGTDPVLDGRVWSTEPDPLVALQNHLLDVAQRNGLTVEELLRANAAYRPASNPPAGWSPPDGVPIVVPEPPSEAPPRWTREDTRAMAQAMVGQCQVLQERVALLDAPGPDLSAEDVLDYRDRFSSSYAGLYWPWLLTLREPEDPDAGLIAIPPSAAVAGLTAAADLRSGPHRSPAGQSVLGSPHVTRPVADREHGRVNRRGVNVLRERLTRGVVLEGTRSLAPLTSAGRAWRFLNVRRVMHVIRESIEEDAQWVVFEGNTRILWADLRDRLSLFLTRLWRRGWLHGSQAKEAFYVRCDETTNPPEEVERGRVVAVVGLRFPPPIEWIVVRLGRSAVGVDVQLVDRV